MTVDNENEKITIFENDNYSLIATVKSREIPTETILNIHLDNNIIYLGELINSETIHEWPNVNDQAVAILRNKNNSNDNEILYIYYVPNNTFIFGNKKQLEIMYKTLFNFNSNESKKGKIKVHDLRI